MDSLTMEIEKAKRDELDHVHEQGLSDAQTHKALHSEADLSERDEAFEETLEDDDHKQERFARHHGPVGSPVPISVAPARGSGRAKSH